MEPTLSPKLAPYLVAQDARGLIRFIEKVLGGRISYEVSDPSGRLVHAEVRIADALVMIGETPEGRERFPAMLHLYVDDAAVTFRKAIAEGAVEVRKVTDSEGGLQRGGVRDAWGNEWWFSSPTKRG